MRNLLARLKAFFRRLVGIVETDEQILERDYPSFTLYSTEVIIFLVLAYTGLTVYLSQRPELVEDIPIVGEPISEAIATLTGDSDGDGIPDSQDDLYNPPGGGGGNGGGGSEGSSENPGLSNLFGANIQAQMPLETRLAVGQALGLAYARPYPMLIKSWSQTSCPDCQAWKNLGMELIWNISNQSVNNEASTFPEDIEQYKSVIAGAIDQFRPAVIVIENEAFLNFSGTPAQYEIMLRAACEVAHSKDIKCASDGVLSSTTALYTYYYYYYVAGDIGKAEDFRGKGFESWQKGATPEQIKQRVTVDIDMPGWINAYKNAGPDYVNIHWYSESGADPALNAQGFAMAIEAFRSATGITVFSNETGQRDENPSITTQRMTQAYSLNLPYLIWYSSDAGANSPRALQNPDGSLRPHGIAFRDFILASF